MSARKDSPAENPPPFSRDLSGDLLGLPGGRPPGPDLGDDPDGDNSLPSGTHWLTRFDPDDGTPYGTLCHCPIGEDHDGSEVVADDDTPQVPGAGPRVDSESWTCRSCGVPHIGKRPADGTCAQCVVTQVTTEPARPDWLPSGAELAEAKADAADRRLVRVRALTLEQCRSALRFLSGYEPEGFDRALDAVAKWDEDEARARVTGAEGGEQHG